MATYDPGDIIPLRDFELAWRITDPRWASLPEAVLDRIKPLTRAMAQELSHSSPLRRPGDDSSVAGEYVVTRRQPLEVSGSDDDTGCRWWFRNLPIESADEVYLCWNIGGGVAAVTDWGTFVEIWEDLWYPFDDLVIFDDAREWAVLFGPGEVVRFAEKSVKPAVV